MTDTFAPQANPFPLNSSIATTPSSGGGSGHYLTTEQVAAGVASCRAAGVDEAAIREAFEGDGYTVPPPGQQEKRTPDEIAWSAATAAPTDASTYDVGGFSRNAVVTDELIAAIGANPLDKSGVQVGLDRAVRDCFATMKVPAAVAKSLAEMMADSARRFAAIKDPATKQLERQAARYALTQALGPDAVKEASDAIALWRLKSPKLFEAMANSDMFSDPRILGQLALVTRRSREKV